MAYYMGIDGGGSTLRVVITDSTLHPITTIKADSANPSSIGRHMATSRIQAAMQQALQAASLNASQIRGVAAGIAGTSTSAYDDWFHDTLHSILPTTQIIRSSDVEIALVGAIGRESGLMALAGTGSVAYGINAAGDRLQMGGRGYLVGDECGAYWLGKEAIRLSFLIYDGMLQTESLLPDILIKTLNLQQMPDLIIWLYGRQPTPVQEIAALAPSVLDAADNGDAIALDIIQRGADAMALHITTLRRRLQMPDDSPIAFAGGLLERDNLLSQALCERLSLAERPQAQLSPVMGAALLAKLRDLKV